MYQNNPILILALKIYTICIHVCLLVFKCVDVVGINVKGPLMRMSKVAAHVAIRCGRRLNECSVIVVLVKEFLIEVQRQMACIHYHMIA